MFKKVRIRRVKISRKFRIKMIYNKRINSKNFSLLNFVKHNHKMRKKMYKRKSGKWRTNELSNNI